MPELPEVEVTVQSIASHLIGRSIARAAFSVARQVHPQRPATVARALRGARIRSVGRRGKYVVIGLDTGTLLIHLRMTGGLRLRSAVLPAGKHERACFLLDDGCETLVFEDPRKLGTIRYYAAGVPIEPLNELGWEPLQDRVGLADVRAVLKRRKAVIKAVLLDQSVWAGIGNIYASEALYEARLDPRKRAARLTREETARLIAAIPRLLRRAGERGGTTLRDFRDGGGRRGSYQNELRVYGREGEACRRCRRPIIRIVQNGRSTYFCRSCQRGR